MGSSSNSTTAGKTPSGQKSKPYPIVAIGASAGGLEAVSELLTNISPDTGMAFVYVQHLDPTHKSMLSEILQRTTKMKVVEAKHLMHIEPNRVFVIPPNKDMAIVDGVVTVLPRKPKPFIQMSVDKFFASLADKQKELSIGVVLSGNANDGTYGLKSIKLAGGITFAQDDSAKFQSMPRSAIAEGVVDMVLPPKQIAKELERISKHPELTKIASQKTDDSEEEITEDDQQIVSIISLMKKGTGVDFSHYKLSTIKRRIIRRMLIYKLESLKDYLDYIKQHTNEITILYQDILINVTNFFRDADIMEYVKKTLIPKILSLKQGIDPVRVWVPACSTGEEAYFLAIIFKEVLEDKGLTTPVQIFATDLSDICIAKARLGLYSVSDLSDVSPGRIKKYFEKIDGGYRVVKQIRDHCIFASHNIFKDPPFSRLDLISCCNLMIYLDSFLQKKLISIFHYAVNNNGYLILGKSETIGNSSHLFSQLEKKYKVFVRKKDASNQTIFDMHFRMREIEPLRLNNVGKIYPKKDTSSPDIEKSIQNILLREFVPASVVINENMDIVQFHGSTGLFLEPSHGKASLNVLKMARASLVYELRNSVHKASKTGERVKKSGLEINVKGKLHLVSIEVIPLGAEMDEPLFLIIFSELPSNESIDGKTNLTRDKVIKQLQNELSTVKDDMRSIIEDQEASVEELQSANEEIISSNEELQSINEELETSKEEVESANEELATINSELLLRNDQLSESYVYAEAVFETLGEAVIVLDKEYRVKNANLAFYRIFETTESATLGMLLYELGNRQWSIPKLRELLEEVLVHNKSFRDFEMEHMFPMIGKKTMLLNARRIMQKIQGQQLIIVTIHDITKHKQAEKIISEQEARFRNMANNVPVMIWTTDANRQFNFVNSTWLRFTGQSIEQAMSKGWIQCVYKEDVANTWDNFITHYDKKEPYQSEYRLKRSDGEYRWVWENGEPHYSQDGEFIGYICSCVEIHEKKLAHEEVEKLVFQRTRELKEAIEDLNYTNTELSQFAYVASHDLQEPLRKIATFSDRLAEKHKDWPKTEQEYLERIIFSSERMRKLINDLLNFSKTSRPGKEFELTDLNEVIASVKNDLDLLIDEKKAKITNRNLPEISGISVQLHQLFYNLISNSLKFSVNGRVPRISITAKKMTPKDIVNYPNLDKNKTYFEIVVSDNGIGFSPEFRDQVFTIFQRLDNSDKFSGSGIGLALCRKIVTNHKGIIFAESIPGEGSQFHIILPTEK